MTAFEGVMLEDVNNNDFNSQSIIGYPTTAPVLVCASVLLLAASIVEGTIPGNH